MYPVYPSTMTILFVGAEVEGWGMWKTTEGQGPNVWGARGTHSQPVWGKGNIIICVR